MEIQKVSKAKRGISSILYGAPNAGKTYQLGYLPQQETLILDIDGGMVTLTGTDLSVFKIHEDLAQLANIYKYLRTEKHPFKYVAIDNWSELERFFLSSLARARNIEFYRQLEWGNCAQKEREYMRLFRDLTDLGINVIYIAWDMSIDQDDGVRICPMMMRTVTGEFTGLADNVWYLRPDPNINSKERYLITESTQQIIAKTRVPFEKESPLPKVIKNPNIYQCLKKLEKFYN